KAKFDIKNHLGETPLHTLMNHLPGDDKDSIPLQHKLVMQLKNKALLNATDNLGNTPLILAAAKNNILLFEQLLELGANPNIANKLGITALEILVHHEAGSLSKDKIGSMLLLEKGANPYQNDSSGVPLMDWVALNSPARLLLWTNLGIKLTPTAEAIDNWFHQHYELNPTSPGVLGLIDLMPQLLLKYQPSSLKKLFNRVETLYDTHPLKKGYHPNEAELLLLLRHPEYQDEKTPDYEFGMLTRALTSITHFIDTQAPLKDNVIHAWKDIGLLTHGFRFWRYDTQLGNESLLSAFGFTPAPPNRKEDDRFGKGFFYQDPDSKTVFEFRRGYLLASHKDHGTLIIRNSSPAFGRDTLKHPAYLLPISYTPNDLIKIRLEKIQSKWSVLNKDLYWKETEKKETSAGNDLYFLTQALMKLKEDYRRFKLDTQAFENTVQGTKEFTGHLSPGLPKLVEFLKKLQAQGKPLPDLAFVNPNFPIWEPYGRWSLTSEHLNELRDFVSGRWTSEKYPNSSWIQFLHQAGVENRGELVMIEPVKSEAVKASGKTEIILK
ncbi:MAG: ankyrin repeat domain-containing protein, partial [Cyanobacteria bacterium]|nr:ankyrin repeat domain-containing protein [Cyanobacteriota bacterium]